MLAIIKKYETYIAVIAFLAALVGSYVFGYHVRNLSAEAEIANAKSAQSQADAKYWQNQVAQTKANDAMAQSVAVKAAEAKQKTNTVYQTITRTVTQYVQTHPDNVACTMSDDGVQLWNQANTAATAEQDTH